MTANTGRYNTVTSSEEVLRQHERRAKGKKYRINYKRLIPFCIICILVIVGLIFGIRAIVKHNSGNSDKSQKVDTSQSAAGADTTTEFTFTATGDNLIHKRLYQQAAARSTDGTYDFAYCYKDVADFYKGKDVNWVNQESLANNKIEASSYPTFSTPGQVVEDLYDIGMRIFSVSNNHTYDKGAEGLAATADLYTNDMPNDILYTGLWNKEDTTTIPIYTYKNIKIAFLSYTEMTNGITTPSDSTTRVIYTSETDIIKQQVEKANQEADIVIVGCHWGTEDSHIITSSQTTLAQNLSDWGADLIIGTHPHVVQNAQWLTAADGHKTFVAYSLGNFLSTQAQPDELVGLVLSCSFKVTQKADGTSTVELENPQLIPTVTVYGSNASNCHVSWLADCTDLSGHGVRAAYPGFSFNYACQILKKYVSSDYLVMPEAYTKSQTTSASSGSGTSSTTKGSEATEVAAGAVSSSSSTASVAASTAAVAGAG